MKPYKKIYEKICDFENLYEAYRKAALGKRFRNEVLLFSADLERNLHELRSDLVNETYTHGGYNEFYVHEPKKRLIMSVPFRDRVVHWAVYRQLNPLFSKSYIKDSYACIEGRGLQQATARLQNWAQLLEKNGGKPYYLKLDIAKYYYRIDHDTLLDILRRKIDDAQLIRLLERIIKGGGVPFGLADGATLDSGERIFGRGMPIGNLTSQMFANIYLNDLDQYVKRELKASYYVRYMDDMAILAPDKTTLHEYKAEIERFLAERLKLSLNDKTAIRPVSDGVAFCGYRIWGSHVKLRKTTAKYLKRRLRKLMSDYAVGKVDYEDAQRVIASYKGILQHCDSYALRTAIYGDWDENGKRGGWFVLQRNSEQNNNTGDGE